jgi:hypothetical protein
MMQAVRKARKTIFQVGDLIRQHQSKDEGHIVRIVNNSEIRPLDSEGNLPIGKGYIVWLPANRYRTAKEALWRDDEIAAVDCAL